MSCFGSFTVSQSSGHSSPPCCSGNSLSARQDTFLPSASVSPHVTRLWDAFSDDHAYLLGLCLVKTFTGGEKPRKDLIKLCSPSEGQRSRSLPAAYVLKCVISSPSVLCWFSFTPWGGLCPCNRVTIPPQTKACVGHTCLVKTWPRGSTTSQLLQDAGASWEIDPQFSPSSSKAHELQGHLVLEHNYRLCLLPWE